MTTTDTVRFTETKIGFSRRPRFVSETAGKFFRAAAPVIFAAGLEKKGEVWYNICIMKKYCFFIVFAAALLSGCKNDRTVTVIYTDVPPPLTKMSYEESLPPETYSQYMETYTHTSETESLGHFRSLLAQNGIAADTGITAPSVSFGDGSRHSLIHDTAVSMPEKVTPGTAETNAETSVPTETSVPAEGEETVTCAIAPSEEETETVRGTAVTLSRPKADTLHSGSVSADTAPTRFEASETSESETSE